MVMNMRVKDLLSLLLIIIFSTCSNTADQSKFNKGMVPFIELSDFITNKITESLGYNKKLLVNIYPMQPEKRQLELSFFLAEEITSSLKANGYNITVNSELLGDDLTFYAGITSSHFILTGSFRDLGDRIKVYNQIVSSENGLVINSFSFSVLKTEIKKQFLKKLPLIKNYKGVAFISHQCLKAEIKCPPKQVLIQRAINVARVIAMEKASMDLGVQLSTNLIVENQRLNKNIIEVKNQNKLENISFSKPIVDIVKDSVHLNMEVLVK